MLKMNTDELALRAEICDSHGKHENSFVKLTQRLKVRSCADRLQIPVHFSGCCTGLSHDILQFLDSIDAYS